MMKLFQRSVCLSLLLLPMMASAMVYETIKLQHVRPNINDKASIERGARFFATRCMMCHAMKYLQHDPVAKKAGILLEKMPTKDQEWWFGMAPPDLSLVAQSRGSNWIYTFLHSFYQDASRQLGSSNLLIEQISMPNPFQSLQGPQVLALNKAKLLAGEFKKKPRWFNALRLEKQGSMTPAEFDQTTMDLVNFFYYAADPHKAARERLGWWVLGFLVILAILLYLLKREYWKDLS